MQQVEHLLFIGQSLRTGVGLELGRSESNGRRVGSRKLLDGPDSAQSRQRLSVAQAKHDARTDFLNRSAVERH